MARPSKGSQGRTITATTKLSAEEAALLESKYGSTYNALRVAVTLLVRTLEPKMQGKRFDGAFVDEVHSIAPADLEAMTPEHRHRRGAELDSVYANGQRVRRFACIDPSCDEVLQ